MKKKPENSLWTDKQWEAIILTDNNILVSAGAGSGKTAVLTERILEKLKDGIDLSNLIVLTFTNAAAKEMKERVYKKLEQEIANGNNSLSAQLEKIDGSQITTFDSYCMFLLQKYYYKLNVGKTPKIFDKLLISQKKKEIITSMFEEYFEKQNKDFLNLIDVYTYDNDNGLKDDLIKMHNSYKQTMNKREVESFFTESYFNNLLNELVLDLKVKTKYIENKVNELYKYDIEGVLTSYIDKNNEKYQMYYKAESYKEFVNAYDYSKQITVRKPNKNKLGDNNEAVDAIKSDIDNARKEIENKLKYNSEKELKDIYFSTFDYVKTIEQLIIEFDKRLKDYKKSINTYEYIDINLFVIELLKNNSDVRKEIKDEINEILVDEYQDTNDIQELCLDLISNGHNLYAVGDIKQAIYGFRNANPDNFRNKYLNYQRGNGGVLIDLNKNFRSRKEVLDNINLIFEKLIDEKIGGVNYEDNQKLDFGNKTYQEHNPLHDNNMMICTYSKNELKEREIDQDEYEIEMMAKDIIEKMNSGYQVYDNDIKKLRNCRLSDFAILTETKKKHSKILEIFESHKINVMISDFNKSFVSSQEIILIKNALKIINSLNDYKYAYHNLDFALMSFMRCFLFEVDDDLIDQIISKLKEDMKENLFSDKYFLQLFENSKYINAMKIICDIAKRSQDLSINEITSELISKLDIMQKISRLQSISAAESNIYSVLQKTKDFDDLYYSLSDFIEFIDNVKIKHDFNKVSAELDIDIESSNDSVFEAVRVMTIHKSKGLEFPVCYFPFFYVNFNSNSYKEKFIYDKDLGYLIRGINEKGNLTDTILFDEYKRKLKLEGIGEKLRLLYVALTRAKEQMVFYLNNDNDKQLFDEILNDNERLSASNYQFFLNNISNIIATYHKELSYEFTETFINENNQIKDIEEENVKIEYQNFTYQKREVESKRASMSKHEILDKKTIANINYGNELHEQLEFINFDDLDNEIKNVNKDIQNVLNNIKKIVKTNDAKYYSEYQFQYLLDDSLTTGIIDLLVETEDKLIIIDYKLNNIDKEEYIKQLHTYKDYLNIISDKKVEMYLLAIIANEYKEIK